MFMEDENLKHFNKGTGFGQWEEKKRGKAIIRKEKAYDIGGETHISGLSREKQTIEALTSKTTMKRMTSLSEAIREGDLSKTGEFTTIEYELRDEEEREITEEYDETRNYTFACSALRELSVEVVH